MAKNLGRKFAVMSDDERRRFALQENEGSEERPSEVAFDDPRDPEHTGSQFAGPREEFADPEHRDGMSAQLDDAGHEQAVRDDAARPRDAEDEE